MLKRQAIQGASVINQALNNRKWDELKALLRDKQFNASYDLAEIEALFSIPDLDAEIKMLAFFNLITRANLETITRLASGVDLTLSDQDYDLSEEDFYASINPSALFLAVFHGRVDVMMWLRSVLSATYLNQQQVSCDLLIAAACNGSIEIMQTLVRSYDPGGFGCNLFDEEFFDTTENFPILSAIYHGRLPLFNKMMMETSEGGFGLKAIFESTYKLGSIDAAVNGIQIDLLKALIKLGIDISKIGLCGVVRSAIDRRDFTLVALLATPVQLGGLVGMQFNFDEIASEMESFGLSEEEQINLMKELHQVITRVGGKTFLPDETYNLKEKFPIIRGGYQSSLGRKFFAWLVLMILDQLLLNATSDVIKTWLQANIAYFYDETLISLIHERMKSSAEKNNELVKYFLEIKESFEKKYFIQAKRQTHVQIADKPLSQGGISKKVLIEEFEETAGCTFLEKIDTSQCRLEVLSHIKPSISAGIQLTSLLTQLEILLKFPRNDLIITKINDQVRFGVFASRKIPAGNVLCFYSGTVVEGNTLGCDESFGMHASNISVSTLKHRGIGSFFQHLPAKLGFSTPKERLEFLQSRGNKDVSLSKVKIDDELYGTRFVDKEAERSLATANVRVDTVFYHGIPVLLFTTSQKIKAGEQLGIVYGSNYWLARNIAPEFFDKSGNVIPASAYRRTFYKLSFGGNIFYTGEFLPLIQQVKLGKPEIIFTDDHQKIRRVKFNIVLDELIRKRGIVPGELEPPLQGDTSLYDSSSVLFKTSEIEGLVKRYKLPDTTQASLEKGLRNAVANDNYDDLMVFIRLVKNINATDINKEVGRTALHWAAFKGNQRCFNVLLQSGADGNIKDAKGVAAFDMCKPYTNGELQL